MIIVTPIAYNKLSQNAKAELLAAVFGPEVSAKPVEMSAVLGAEHGFTEADWVDVARLSPGQVEQLIDDATSLYEGTLRGLSVFAEHGPILHSTFIKEHCLDENGDTYWPHGLSKFQGGTTRRARAVTDNKHAVLLAWPTWIDSEGYYGVTPETHRSLRIYFNLD